MSHLFRYIVWPPAFLLSVVCGQSGRAQNLVPNPGFEAYTACPNWLGEINNCVSWGNEMYWTSSDYFNACLVYIPNVNNSVGVPDNFVGHLEAYDGDAYAGIILFDRLSGTNYREYIFNWLSTPMLAGIRYRVSFQAATTYPITNSNMLGMRIGTAHNDSIWERTSVLPPTLNPVFSSDSVFKWKEWASDYVATGGERYIAIGNFHTDSTYTGVPIQRPGINVYAFIDAVSIVPVGQNLWSCAGDPVNLVPTVPGNHIWIAASDTLGQVLSAGPTLTVNPSVSTSYIAYGANDTAVFNVFVKPLPHVFLGNDTTICENRTIHLQPQGTNPPGTLYQWQDGSTTASFTPVAPGTYHIQARFDGCSASDSIHIDIDSAITVNLGPDIHLCDGDSLLLHAVTSRPVDSYLWQDQSADSTLPVYTAGVYSVSVSHGACSASDNLTVIRDPLPVLSLGNDTLICGNGPLLLDATHAGAGYLWNNGATTPTLPVNVTGIYSVTLSVTTCSVTDSIEIRFVPPPSVNLGPDTSLCSGQPLLLSVPPGLGSLWQDGSAAASFTVQVPGQYRVTVTDSNGCRSSDEITVTYIAAPQFSFTDTVLCDGNLLTLDIGTEEGIYLWSDKSTGDHYTVTGPGFYWGTARNRCGMATDSLRVDYRSCDCLLYIPGSFTPDGDNRNERFGPVPITGCELIEYTFGIYDRWGGLLYQTVNPDQAWDGSVSGTTAPIGIYLYRVSYRFKGDRLRVENGSLILLK